MKNYNSQFKNHIVLFIDTSNNKRIIVNLQKGEKRFIVSSAQAQAQVTLLLIEKVLQKANVKLEEIDKIEVKKGPGSYTGLKVGVSIANALSLALLKSVNGKKLGEVEEPKYQ